MDVLTPFVAYNVYRADCSRLGFVDAKFPTWSGLPAAQEGSNYDEYELYMEFGEMNLMSNGLGDIDSYDGLAVEVQFNFGAKATGSMSSSTGVFFMIGVCDDRIPAAQTINYANMPSRKYGKVGWSDNWSFAEHDAFGYSESVDHLGGWWVDSNVGRATLCSFEIHNPTDVFNAIRNAALVLKRIPPQTSAFAGSVFDSAIYATGAYQPYVEIAIGTVAPKCSIISPKDQYISPYEPQVMQWQYVCGNGSKTQNGVTRPYSFVVGGECPQAAAEIRINKEGSATEDAITMAGDATSYAVPRDVLDAGGFTWRVAVKNAMSLTSAFTSVSTVTTVDMVPVATANAPKNTYVNVEEAVFFDWTHTIATGTPQSKYELQGLMGGVWTTLQEEETSETSAVVPVDMLSSNITAWRVRTANNDGVYGEYSEPAQVIFIVAPKVTGIAVTGNVRPTIAWQSADQQGYEVMIDGVTTGVQYGTGKSLVWNDLLADGAHVVQVRVVNRFGLFSQWAEATHEVVNVPQEVAPVLTAAMVGNADVQLMWAGEGAAETLVYRDGELIGRAQSAGVYVDHTAYDEHVYRVRVVAANSNYTDSNEVRVIVPLRETMLAAVGEWNWIELAYSATAEPPVRTAELMPLYALNYYSGREKPVAEMSRHKSATYSVTYAVTKQQAAQLRGMMGKIVVHKRKGELIRGLLQSVSEARTWWGVDLTLQIVEVDEG